MASTVSIRGNLLKFADIVSTFMQPETPTTAAENEEFGCQNGTYLEWLF